jgi:hypothetical protein
MGTIAISAVSNSVTPQADWTPPEVGDFLRLVSCFLSIAEGDTGYIAGETHGFNCGNRDQVPWYTMAQW